MMSRLKSARQGKWRVGTTLGRRDGKSESLGTENGMEPASSVLGRMATIGPFQVQTDMGQSRRVGHRPELLDTLSWNSLAGWLFYRDGNYGRIEKE